jgi:hypothetical protein
MRDLLRRHLSPDDDGHAFVEAVLFRASGTLHRRRAATSAALPAWGWLERWARPWVVVMLILLAFATLLPLRRPAPVEQVAADAEVQTEALLTAAQPEDVFALTEGR